MKLSLTAKLDNNEIKQFEIIFRRPATQTPLWSNLALINHIKFKC